MFFIPKLKKKKKKLVGVTILRKLKRRFKVRTHGINPQYHESGKNV